jgi:hypothetical protein
MPSLINLDAFLEMVLKMTNVKISLHSLKKRQEKNLHAILKIA